METTGQLRAAVLEALTGPGDQAGLDALIMAAAVADFTPMRPSAGKLTRGEGAILELSPTPDILAEAARIARGLDTAGQPTRQALRPVPVLVGFAAEAGSLDRVPGKLARKQVDLIVGNDITAPGSGFGTDTNHVVIFDAAGGQEALPLLAKREVADRILDRVARLLVERDVTDVDGGAATTQTVVPTQEGQP